jgi:hypothetical protein
LGKWLSPIQSGIRRKEKRNVTRVTQASKAGEYINSVKSKGCSLCGYKKCLSAIEFHHVTEGKKFELSSVGSRSLRQIQDEISKCVVICANCHREVHSGETGRINHRHTDESSQEVLIF